MGTTKLKGYDGWLQMVNLLFLGYIARRRIKDGLRGTLYLQARRIECQEIAKFFADWEVEADPRANREELKRMFEEGMARLDAPAETT